MIGVKPFMLFEGEDYYPSGGWRDFAGAYATLDEAQRAKSDPDYNGGWAHVVDVRTGEFVSFKERSSPWSERDPELYA